MKRETLLTKPELGHLKKNDCPPLRHLTEFKLESIPEGLEVGSELDPTEMFSVGDKVDVAGRSVGKGFAGGIKRHGFSRGLMSHGSKSHRFLKVGTSKTSFVLMLFEGEILFGSKNHRFS